jgi:hypothetical protein
MKLEHIKIEGHRGFWYEIAREKIGGRELVLLEHETYGDEAPSLIVTPKGNLVMEDVYNGFYDYKEDKGLI